MKTMKALGKNKQKTLRQSKGFLHEEHIQNGASEKSGESCFCLSGRSSMRGPSKQSSFLMQNKETKRSIRSKVKHMKTFANKYKAFY